MKWHLVHASQRVVRVRSYGRRIKNSAKRWLTWGKRCFAFSGGEPLEAAFRDVRWGVAVGILYPVLCVVVALLLSLSELERTAAHGPEVVKRIPYWHEVGP